MGYDEFEFADLELRENDIKRMYVEKERTKDKESLLCVDTDHNCYIGVIISTYEQTRRDLEKELSLRMEDVRQIRITLECFDENWSKIDEYVNESTVEGEEKQGK